MSHLASYFLPNRLFIYLIAVISMLLLISSITLPAYAIHSFSHSDPIEQNIVQIKPYIPKQALLIEIQNQYNVVYFKDNNSQLSVEIKRVLNEFGYILQNYHQTYVVITQHINTHLGYERLFNIATYIALHFDIEEERIQLLFMSEDESRLYQNMDDNWQNSAEVMIPKAIIITYDPEFGIY